MLQVAVKKRLGALSLDAKFELPTPGVVALFGRSGCGKSTLINVISGLLDADSGRVALDDAVLLDTAQRLDVPPERRRIGYVFQESRLFPHFDVAGNLRYAARRAGSPRFVGFDLVVELLDLKPLMHRRAHQLSGGERQRVAIARAVHFGAKVLILDEPTSALGVKQASVVLRYVAQARARRLGVIFITHNVHHAWAVGDKFTVLNRGRTLGTFAKGAIAREELLNMMAGGRELEELGAELEEFARADTAKGRESPLEDGAAAERAMAETLRQEVADDRRGAAQDHDRAR